MVQHEPTPESWGGLARVLDADWRHRDEKPVSAEPGRQYLRPEWLFLCDARGWLAGREVEGRRLVIWHGQWLAKYHFERGEHTKTAMIELALGPGKPWGLKVKQ